MDSAQGSQRDKPYTPIWVVRPEQGQSDAHRITRDIRHRTCSSNLTFQHLKARLNQASPDSSGCILAIPLSVCKTSHRRTVCLSGEEGTAASQSQNHPSTAARLSSPKCLSTVEVQNAQASICPGPPFLHHAGAEQALCSGSPRGRLACLLQWLCLWQASPLSLSLCPYQGSTAGPGARPHSLNYRLRRTQCSLLCADRDTFMARVQS